MPNKQTMPNSQKDSFGNAALMWRMLGLARPLAGWMVIAIACGVMGFCCATGIPVLAAEAALCNSDPVRSRVRSPQQWQS